MTPFRLPPTARFRGWCTTTAYYHPPPTSKMSRRARFCFGRRTVVDVVECCNNIIPKEEVRPGPGQPRCQVQHEPFAQRQHSPHPERRQAYSHWPEIFLSNGFGASICIPHYRIRVDTRSHPKQKQISLAPVVVVLDLRGQ